MIRVLSSRFLDFLWLIRRMWSPSNKQSFRIPIFNVRSQFECFTELWSTESKHVHVGVHDFVRKMNVALVSFIEHRRDDDIVTVCSEKTGDIQYAKWNVCLRVCEPRR